LERTTCAVIGGGPAGMVLGLLLARAGVAVTVLEKHADFLRDFRGDTVHPSTLALLDELGLWPRFAAIPHSRIERVTVRIGDRDVTVADFARLRHPHPYLAMVPQWDLLDLLAGAAADEPGFELRMGTEVTGLRWAHGRICGVSYRVGDHEELLAAELTVACDGRWSTARTAAGLVPHEYPVPFDVWWFRVPRRQDGTAPVLPRIAPGRALIMLPRPGYYQAGYLIPKGSDGQRRARGLEAFRAEIAELAPEADVAAIGSFDDVRLLDVRLNRLRRWYVDGLLCIGDAAHAMSPAGGVGINLAVQDAVAAAALLAGPLRRHRVTVRDLAAVQRRRAPATVLAQAMQRVVHRRLLGPVLRGKPPDPPARLPGLPALTARLVGVGIRPERTPDFARRRPADG